MFILMLPFLVGNQGVLALGWFTGELLVLAVDEVLGGEQEGGGGFLLGWGFGDVLGGSIACEFVDVDVEGLFVLLW